MSSFPFVGFFFLPDRPTITRDGAMGNEAFYWDGPIRSTSWRPRTVGFALGRYFEARSHTSLNNAA